MANKPAKAKSPEQSGPMNRTKPEFFDPAIRFGVQDDQVEQGISLTKRVTRSQADAEFEAQAVAAQKAFYELADKIAASAPLNTADRMFAIHAIRYAAGNIRLKPARKRGQAPKLDPSIVAWQFACLVRGRGISKSSAHGELAAEWDVSIEAIKRALIKRGDLAVDLWNMGVRLGENLKKDLGY